MIEIPAPLFGHRPARVVADNARVPIQLTLPAQLVRQLTLRANATGATMSHVAADCLRQHLVDDPEGEAPGQ